ncbi:sulfite exporter TauE/SafE family protein [Cytobacillus spongiae]|uniref:sulfite exporter TauE/SafE family protein n=1 Tax=Cytobacillus spongiae TaxID=2901381 RepID=UPI001F218172|nr:sulfite exporter TauE/SafE family protein [Cytobacillus spongiae]UII55432.1 sulfite exporter TauE/SafE family protein [Cytobacillus spongiae]
MEWFVLILIGLVAGTLGALIGLGGGIIVVPALLFFGTNTSLLQGITPQVAVGTSLFIMIFTGLSSTLTYMKHKTVDYKSGLIFFMGSGPGGIVGAWVNKALQMDEFQIYFGLFMIFVSFILIIRGRLKPLKLKQSGIQRTFTDAKGDSYVYGYHPVLGIGMAFVVGFISGIFGIGGGSLMVPAMIVLFLFPPHVAVATSMFMIFLSAIVSSMTHISLGNVNWLYAFALVPGAWVGAKVGAFINSKLQSQTLVAILRVLLIVIGLQLIYEGLAV